MVTNSPLLALLAGGTSSVSILHALFRIVQYAEQTMPVLQSTYLICA